MTQQKWGSKGGEGGGGGFDNEDVGVRYPPHLMSTSLYPAWRYLSRWALLPRHISPPGLVSNTYQVNSTTTTINSRQS